MVSRLSLETGTVAAGLWLISTVWAFGQEPVQPARVPAPVPATPAMVESVPTLDPLPGEAAISGPIVSEAPIGLDASAMPCDCGRPPGHLRRFCQKVNHKLHARLIGYPEYFAEPALGWSVYQNFGREKNKADVHTFTLYRSDFIAGTAELSPGGARRLSFMAPRLRAWPGPVVIEWTPNDPNLAEGRRQAVALAFDSARVGFDPSRVIVGPSAYHGIIGPDAGNNHDALIYRNYTAPRQFSVTPTSTAEFGGGSR